MPKLTAVFAGEGVAPGATSVIAIDQGGFEELATSTVAAVEWVGRRYLLHHILIRLFFLGCHGGTSIVFDGEPLAAAAEWITTLRRIAEALDETTIAVSMDGVEGFVGRRGIRPAKVVELARVIFIHAGDTFSVPLRRTAGTRGSLFGLDS